MRIVGGRFRGAMLAAPGSRDIRPTSDRAREAVFNILAHGGLFAPGKGVEGARVLDLFAGSGALGFEALSRGARLCLFVDSGAEARGLIRRNIEALGLEAEAKIYRRDATALGAPGNLGPFDLVFADPPYGKGLAEKAIDSAVAGGWLAPHALCVVEAGADEDFEPPPALELLDRRRYGAAGVVFARLRGGP